MGTAGGSESGAVGVEAPRALTLKAARFLPAGTDPGRGDIAAGREKPPATRLALPLSMAAADPERPLAAPARHGQRRGGERTTDKRHPSEP
jgi:hypothetical protein